jgi:uncharacterized membrane protein
MHKTLSSQTTLSSRVTAWVTAIPRWVRSGRWAKALVAIALTLGLTLAPALGHGSDALAATAGGGRMGGGSFRAPSRGYSAPRSYSTPRSYGGGYGGGYGYGGGGIGFPFLFPFLGFGGGVGSLFTILIFIAVANFLVQTFRNARGEDGLEAVENPTLTVAKVQVGLLADARELQADLNKLALKADTSSTTGLANVLQETSLALLRHPEYWTYAGSSLKQAKLTAAETEFNRLALTERSKFSRETLSNVGSQLKQSTGAALSLAEKDSTLAEQGPGEYIVVTVLVGVNGVLNLPDIKSSTDLRTALQQLGGVSGDRLLALEVLWTPQADGDVLTSDDMLTEYANLRLI